MIRQATHDDIPLIVSMGRDFHAYSPWRHIPFDADGLGVFVGHVIDRGVVLLNDGGMIGGIMNPLYFNPAHSVACELFWWAKSGGRDLMRAFEAWGESNGAAGYQFSALNDDMAERMENLFNRAGYRKMETGYYKDAA